MTVNYLKFPGILKFNFGLFMVSYHEYHEEIKIRQNHKLPYDKISVN